MISRLALGLKFYLGFAPKFSRLGFEKLGLPDKPVTRDLSGQTWLVTGASGGIGEAIVAQASHLGARVIAVARSRKKLDTLADVIDADAQVDTLAADLSLMSDTRSLVATLAQDGSSIDVLVNNVGVLLNEHSVTAEGFETSFATNLLNHYLLTEQLIEAGAFGADACVINMSSGGMYSTPLEPARMNVTDPARHDGVMAYARHKRGQVELTRYWNRRYGDRLRFYVMHPGWVDTVGVQTSLPGFRKLFHRILREAPQGADTALWLGAERPAVVDEGIWLDRTLRPEHVGAATRSGPERAAQLLDFLKNAVAAST